MKKNTLIKLISLVMAVALAFGLWAFIPATETLAYDGDINQDYINDPSKTTEAEQQKAQFESEGGWYLYDIDIDVENPYNKNGSDPDQINCFRWDFTYIDNNGYGSEKTYRLTMEYSGGRWQNSSVLERYFVRSDDNSASHTMKIWLPGKLTKLHIFLNMDYGGFWNTHGDRVTVKVKKISCNGIQISTNEDYVSSISNDSNADINCTMAQSYPVSDTQLTTKEMQELISGKNKEDKVYDQFGAVLKSAALEACLNTYDGDVNQNLSHSDEAGYYKYTLKLRVSNPINRTDAGTDCIEKFYFKFTYKTDNGLGESKTYYLDLYKLNGKWQNQQLINKFMADNDDGYDLDIDVWVPGQVSNVDVHLNMNGGERLYVEVQSIMCNGVRISRKIDYVSSSYYDSDATIPCQMSHGQVVTTGTEAMKTADVLKDQYGSICSETLINAAYNNPARYIYRYSQIS